MIKLQYLQEIAHAETARTLHNLREMAATDAELTVAEREKVNHHIANRFAALNSAGATFKPRWA